MPALEALAVAGLSTRQPLEAVCAGNGVPDEKLGELGDFRLLRQIGRGGMGVVYEAEQISLRRHVALKVLPFAAVLDKQSLQRFRNEALVAATLEHRHIVSVYSVGSDRGVHYYAMQLIEGKSLADLIAELSRASDQAPTAAEESAHASATGTRRTELDATSRTRRATPSTARSSAKSAQYRWVAELGIQAARALAHAHQHGVLHRDIKPGNLLLDTQGDLLVTDFGLARIETTPKMTMTGDLFGTLRYMSPEQALGRRSDVGEWSDIYSLGATLYELATLRPRSLTTATANNCCTRSPSKNRPGPAPSSRTFRATWKQFCSRRPRRRLANDSTRPQSSRTTSSAFVATSPSMRGACRSSIRFRNGRVVTSRSC